MTKSYNPTYFGTKMIQDDYEGKYVDRIEFIHRVDELRKANHQRIEERDMALEAISELKRRIGNLEYQNEKLKAYESIALATFRAVADSDNRMIKEQALIETYNLTQPVINATVSISHDSIPVVEQKGEAT